MGKMMQQFLNEVAVAVDTPAETPAAHYLYNVDNESESCQIMRERELIFTGCQGSLYSQAWQARTVDCEFLDNAG